MPANGWPHQNSTAGDPEKAGDPMQQLFGPSSVPCNANVSTAIPTRSGVNRAFFGLSSRYRLPNKAMEAFPMMDPRRTSETVCASSSSRDTAIARIREILPATAMRGRQAPPSTAVISAVAP
jgi:hypothetical protein